MLESKTKTYVIPPQGAIVEVKAIEPFSILELDDDDKPVSIITSPVLHFRKKIYGCEQIQVVPQTTKSSYQVTVEPSVVNIDLTPIETPVEIAPQNLADLRVQMMGIMEQERRKQHKPTFEEFSDLEMPDNLDDILEGVGTVYEAESEALRQHYNPFRRKDHEEVNQTPPGASQKAESTSLEQEITETGTKPNKQAESL